MKYMKLKTWMFVCLLSVLAAACIKDEAPNAEADIVTCTLSGDVLNRDPIIENNKVTLYVKKTTNVGALAPEFTLTPGATITPASGTTLDFTRPQSYIVTSEDRKWQKTYSVEVTTSGITNTRYGFENVRFFSDTSGEPKYQIFYETDQYGKEIMTWASGNPGFALTGQIVDYTGYPTYSIEQGMKGKCLGLTTRRTGNLGNIMNMPLAAGNLFIGTFDVINALTNPLTSTRFGEPFYYVPTYLKGYYKYTSGDTFYELDESASDKLRPVTGRRDICDIYAIFYESTDDVPTLDGTNMLTSPNLVAVARISDAHETEEWTAFYLPFEFIGGRTVDNAKLAEGKYNLAIVFSSSIRGDYFEGAPESTLLIDEVELGYEDTTDEEEE